MLTTLRLITLIPDTDEVNILTGALDAAGIATVILEARDEDQFVKALREGSPDMVITDARERDTLDYRQALELAATYMVDIPLIVISSTPVEEEAVRVMGAGAHDYITHESLARLAPAIQRELRDAASRRARRRSERKRQEALEALEASEQRFRRLLEGLRHSFVFARNSFGRLVEVSEGATNLTGFTPRELIESGRLPLTASPVNNEAQEALQAVLRGERPPTFEMEITHRDGTTRWLEVAEMPVVRDGSQVRSEGLVTDITHLKQLQSELIEAQRMESVGRLAGGIAHDFNNMLTIINGCAELMLGSLREGDSLHRDAQDILNAGTRAADLTRQLLAFSRRQMLHPVRRDLNKDVTALEGMVRRALREDITLSLDCRATRATTLIDPGQFEQILLNLALNARDAMPRGGHLTIETDNFVSEDHPLGGDSRIPPGDYVMVAITDDGAGMVREIADKAFDPFFTTKKLGEGTGMGLSMVYGVVKQSRGHILLYTEPDMGSCFKLYFPVDSDVPSDALEPPRREGGTETILLVEDDGIIRKLLSRVLSMAGYKIIEARDGQEAARLAASRQGEIHLLVTDVVMPGMGGRELRSTLIAERSGIKVLFMSGYSEEMVKKQGIMPDGAFFVQKPVSPSEILKIVRKVLDR